MNSKRVAMFGCACMAVALLWPANASAQRRVVYPVRARTSVVLGAGFGPYYGGLWSPLWYNPFYYGFYPIYPAYPGYGYGYGAYYWSAARLEIKPKNAQVYLDGYYVGVVDQFDGIFQRLDVPTGEHELAVYLPGFHTYTQRVLFRPGETLHFKAILQPLPPGAPPEPQPQPQPSPNARQPYQRPQYGPPAPYRQPPPEAGEGRPMPPPRPPERGMTRDEGDFGTLAIRVQPANAIVTIDGERWDSPDGGSRLLVQLAAGQHRIDVSKDGYKPYSATIEIRPGETQNVNVSLPASGDAR